MQFGADPTTSLGEKKLFNRETGTIFDFSPMRGAEVVVTAVRTQPAEQSSRNPSFKEQRTEKGS